MRAPPIIDSAQARRPPIARRRKLKPALMAPIRYSLMYLWGTFGIFLLSNLAHEVQNMLTLCFFVSASFVGLYYGFRIGVTSHSVSQRPHAVRAFGKNRLEIMIIIVGCFYFTIWGINQIYEYGGSSLSGIINTILTPGAAYKAKFQIYQEQLDTNRVNRITQILILSSIIYAIYVPFGIVVWKKLRFVLKFAYVASILIYISGFLFIGTMKGVGDIFLFVIAGVGVLIAKHGLSSRIRMDRRLAAAIIVILGVSVFAYMAFNQVERAEQFGIKESAIVGDVSDTLLAKAFGQNIAFGIYSVLAYPSHGYLGLSYSLQQPFEFSYGAGFSQAAESYRLQFLGGQDHRFLTYPFRSELATGWPAGMYWSTIFPWLASDMTFYLVPVFMLIVGFIFARVWIACLFGNSILALAALGQFVVFIAFIPANNQLLMQRQGFWVVVSLVLLWGFNFLRSRRSTRHV